MTIRPLVVHGTLPGGAPFKLAMDPSCFVVIIATDDSKPIVCTRGEPRTIEQVRAIVQVSLAFDGKTEADVQDLNHGQAPSSPMLDHDVVRGAQLDGARANLGDIAELVDLPRDANGRDVRNAVAKLRQTRTPDPGAEFGAVSPRDRIAIALANDAGLSWADEAIKRERWFEMADACLRQSRRFTSG